MKKLTVPTFVKWAGGKTQLLNQFELFIPSKIDRYFEPFIGSGAVFFYVKKTRNPDYYYISDSNEDLVNLYITVRDNLGELIRLLKEYKKEHMINPKKVYYHKRGEFNTTKDILVKSALLLYLNKTCFNGLYRVNSKGEFNVPMGSYKNPAILQQTKLNEASKLLQDVTIKCMQFERIVNLAKQKDFIYFDPPYYPLSLTSSFTSYHKDEFLDKEQKELAKVFQKLDKRGCVLMLSNSDTPFIHKVYKKYEREGHLYLVKAKRMINSDARGRKAINEVVITNYKKKLLTKNSKLPILTYS